MKSCGTSNARDGLREGVSRTSESRGSSSRRPKDDNRIARFYTAGVQVLSADRKRKVGGWAYFSVGQVAGTCVDSGAEEKASINRMELTAAVNALRSLRKPCEVVIATRATYVTDAGATLAESTRVRGRWTKRFSRKDVPNYDLWCEFVKLARLHRVSLKVANWQGYRTAQRLARASAAALAAGP